MLLPQQAVRHIGRILDGYWYEEEMVAGLLRSL